MAELFAITFLGLIVGTTYGLLAVGLVIVHRSSKVINFAHGDIGIFAGLLFGALVVESGFPYYVALPLAVSIGVVASVVTDVVVMRRLRDTPAITKIVATIGVAAFLQVFALVLAGDAVLSAGRAFPKPPGFPEFDVGPLRVTSDYSAMLLTSPLVVAALALFLQRSRFGTAVRAAAANDDAARLTGISASRMSTLSWAIAGALSAYTAILLIPSRAAGGAAGAIAFGPGLLMRGLAAAVLARMTSLPIAMAGGITLGVLEQHLLYRQPSLGRVDAVLLAVVVIALLLQRRAISGRLEDGAAWLNVQLPGVARRHERIVSRASWAGAALVVLFGAALLPVITNSAAVILTTVMAFAVLGLGLGIISGLAGQLSLGHFGIAAIGAVTSYLVVDKTDNFVLALPCAVLAGAAVATVLGVPAVRIHGLMFAVVTMSFALAVPWLLEQDFLFAQSQDPGRPVIGGTAIETSKQYYGFVLVFTVISFLLARNVWRGPLGRRLRAVRDNEKAARAFGIRATAVKLQAFALGGAFAGFAGALYAHSQSSVSSSSFPVQGSFTAAAVMAVGGIGSLVGPLVGALYIIGLPRFLPLDNAGLAATALGWLLLLLQFPGGAAQAFVSLRDRVLGELLPIDPEATAPPTLFIGVRVAGSEAPGTGRDRAAPGQEILAVRNVSRQFGGVKAVDDVSFEVRAGEILGLIGPNGAGKTTLFELISGFTPVQTGAVLFRGDDITSLAPERRTHLGLVRSFQDAALFTTLTVLETVQLSLERLSPANLATELAGLRREDRRRRDHARELIAMFGLERYEEKRISDLSTGTRRITELACLVALGPELLLLDEPTSGIAQRESEALGGVLLRIRDELQTTMVVVEHDIPLLMSISDRVLAMASGAVIAIGEPHEVREHPEVVASYLGESAAAIARSDAPSVRDDVVAFDPVPQCEAITRIGNRCTRAAVRDGECTQHGGRPMAGR